MAPATNREPAGVPVTVQPPAIEVRQLTRRFGSFTAVDHLSFKVRRGQILGLLGSNGAGKTTLIKMLTTLLPPSEGEACVAGISILTAPAEVRLEQGHVVARSGRVAIGEIARTWYRRPQDLPPDVDPGGLEVTAGYRAKRDTGTFSYAVHAVQVAVDPQTGEVELGDYVIVEDGGVLINPMIVDGQIYGGTAQGIGTALYEEMRFDERAQPLGSTLSDYLLPGPTEIPEIRIIHMETPSPYTRFGQKGLGEGGAIAPPAAITNAINDALSAWGAEILVCPATPRRIAEAIDAAARRRPPS